MNRIKCSFASATCLIALCMLTACGAASPTKAPAPGQNTYHPPSAPFIQIATATINHASKKILATAPGLTLYYSTLDTSTTIACQGACAATWRPLSFAGPGTPIAPSALPGKLSVVTTPNGDVVEYNGHPLYTYVKDTLPGQANGEGLEGTWFVATPDLPKR